MRTYLHHLYALAKVYFILLGILFPAGKFERILNFNEKVQQNTAVSLSLLAQGKY